MCAIKIFMPKASKLTNIKTNIFIEIRPVCRHWRSNAVEAKTINQPISISESV